MALLLPQFKEAQNQIEPTTTDKDCAAHAHTEVRKVLEGDQYLASLGIDTVLIGSYGRQVSIRRIKDVDVFSKLPRIPRHIGSRELLSTFFGILAKGFGASLVQLQDRSVKVEFPNLDLHVDAVPARPHGSHWEIPDRTDRSGEWEETNPERLTDLTSQMNKRHDGLYVPVVKFIRQTRRTHIGEDEQPGGLYFEILTYHAFASGSVGGHHLPEYYCSALDGVARQLQRATTHGLADPTLEGNLISTRASRAQIQAALRVFERLAERAKNALVMDDRCAAAKVFQEILGRNGDGALVFPMPSDCNLDGTPKSATFIIAGDRHVPAGDRRFA